MPLRGLRLHTLRLIWCLLVLCDLLVFFGSQTGFYHVLDTLCPSISANCSITDQLTPQTLPLLQQAGISLHTYAFSVWIGDLLTSAVFLLVGAVIFWRKPDTWMGLFVSFFLINFGSLGVSLTHVNAFAIDSSNNPFYVIMGIISIPLSILAYLCMAFFFFTFPDGCLVPRWSWVLTLLWVVNAAFWVAPPDSPFQITRWPLILMASELFLVFGASLSTQIYRYLRVASPRERQQIKWLIYGLAPVLILPLVLGFLQLLVPSLAGSLFQVVTEPLFRFYYLPIPVCVGIALLFYRLWDIDLIINRTLVYGTLSACVVGSYIAIVAYLGVLFRSNGNLLLSLVATSIVAIAFQPLRNLLQRSVNRLMYGRRDEPYAVLAHLGQRLEATPIPETVLPTIVETIAQTLKLPYVAIQLAAPLPHISREGATPLPDETSSEIVASFGTPVADVIHMPLVYQAHTLGHFVLGARSGESLGIVDQRLLTDLARQAGVAIHAVQLTTELQRARERLVTTREEERRRLRRDLHDGLGPTLASLSFKVEAARNLLSRDVARADTLLTTVATQMQEAITEIRRLVYALRPPALDELGLVAALHDQASQHQLQGIQVSIDAPEPLPALPAAVEVALYRIAQEAMTNITRHAQAHNCTVCLRLEAGGISLLISDDGQGLPSTHRIGIGLHAMHERAAELGGTCEIEPREAGGTIVRTFLPLSSLEARKDA